MANPVGYYITPKILHGSGTIVSLVGQNLDITSTFTIGAGPVVPLERVSTFLTQGGAPAHAVGPVDVVINNSSGSVTMVGAITYV